jgi:hypothetical protein
VSAREQALEIAWAAMRNSNQYHVRELTLNQRGVAVGGHRNRELTIQEILIDIVPAKAGTMLIYVSNR